MPFNNKTAAKLINPPQKELDAVDDAIRALIVAMRRLGAAGTTREVSDGEGVWTIDVQWEPFEGAKPN